MCNCERSYKLMDEVYILLRDVVMHLHQLSGTHDITDLADLVRKSKNRFNLMKDYARCDRHLSDVTRLEGLFNLYMP